MALKARKKSLIFVCVRKLVGTLAKTTLRSVEISHEKETDQVKFMALTISFHFSNNSNI